MVEREDEMEGWGGLTPSSFVVMFRERLTVGLEVIIDGVKSPELSSSTLVEVSSTWPTLGSVLSESVSGVEVGKSLTEFECEDWCD